MNNKITEIKNTLEWLKSRLHDTKNRLWAERVVEITEVEPKKTLKRNKNCLRKLWEHKAYLYLQYKHSKSRKVRERGREPYIKN